MGIKTMPVTTLFRLPSQYDLFELIYGLFHSPEDKTDPGALSAIYCNPQGGFLWTTEASGPAQVNGA